MSWIDWLVLFGTTLFIVVYGVWQGKGASDARSFLVNDERTKGWVIGLSIMATQASAITFLSTTGQGFEDGMRFVQFYFGVPIAMVIISAFFIPYFHKLKVLTAYEYLEQRFDLKTRTFAASLFLISRGMGAGMTIYAPAIILSTLLGWNIQATCVMIGVLVLIYTVSGGARAVSQTQKQQMFVILAGMVIAGVYMVMKLPPDVSFGDAVRVAGKLGKLNAITLPDFQPFDWKDRYNLFSGLIGGAFLALAYFGADQSQVQRYLGGKSMAESRVGLLFNGMLKVPMQFMILFLGALMAVFYLFNPPRLFFNDRVEQEMRQVSPSYVQLEQAYDAALDRREAASRAWLDQREGGQADALAEALRTADAEVKSLRAEARRQIVETFPKTNPNDQDRIFLTFILDHLPHGLIGLLIAVILAAAMSSSSAELSSLGGAALVDFHLRFGGTLSGDRQVFWSRLYTTGWGIFAIFFALFAGQFENLIQAVNILGSLFYGAVLGIFLVAFFLKRVKGTAVFIGAVVGELTVIGCFVLPQQFPAAFGWLDIGFLWYNMIGCLAVIAVSLIVQALLPGHSAGSSAADLRGGRGT